MLLGIGAGLGAFALQALMATFALTIGVQAGLTRSTVLWLFAAGSFLQIFALPSYAALSDRIGRRPVMIAGCIAAIIAIYPILLLIASGNVLGVLLGFVIAMPLVQAAMYGPLAAFTTEIFATGNRYTGASLGLPAVLHPRRRVRPAHRRHPRRRHHRRQRTVPGRPVRRRRRPDQRHHHLHRQGIQQTEPGRYRLTEHVNLISTT